MKRIKINCPAKINLFFNIVGLDNRNYHLVQAVNQTVSLYDYIEIKISDNNNIDLCCNNKEVPTNETNSVYKAAKLFFEYTNIKFGVNINIDKNIPLMSGLGGESTDAAGTLIGLNKLFDTKLSPSELMALGYKIGCDVPFCIVGGTSIISGCGEIVNHCDTNYKYFVIVTPNIGFSTKEMFSLYDKNVKKYIKLPITIGHNDFHKVLNTDILKIMDTIKNSGAVKSFLTGSGSSVVGIFEDEEKLDIGFNFLKNIFDLDYTINKVCAVDGVTTSLE